MNIFIHGRPPHMRRIALIGFAVAALASGAAAAHAQQPTTPAQLTGEWNGTLVLDNSSPRLTLVFQATDTSVAGKVYNDGDLMGEMQNASLKGNVVHFKVDRLDFTGRITGASMAVDLIVFNGSHRSLTLTKARALPDRDGKKPPLR